MRRTLRTYLVGLCVVSLIANPALACHSCGGGWGGGYRYSAPVYYGPVSYGGYYDGCGACGGCEVVVSDCCGGCNSCDTNSEPSITSDHDSKSPTHQREAAPTEAAPPMDSEPTPIQSPPQQPAQVERPIENTPAPQLPATTPPAAVEPEPPLPADETLNPAPPQDDLFNSAPATTTPAPASTPPAAAPVEEPAAAAPAATTPAESSDDLFGTAPAATEPAAPAETPAAEPASAPASAPAATDDLFGTPAEEPATPPATESTPAETPVDASEEKNEENEKKATDDIFGVSPSLLQEAGGLASDEMRVWNDNTGSFSCHARLVRFMDGKVRLAKDNGRTTTVPLARLSASDLEFVQRQASAHQASLLQTAETMSAMPFIAR